MRRLLALPLIAAVALLAAGVANAGRIQQTLTCDPLGTITVTTTNDQRSLGRLGHGQGLILAARHSGQLLRIVHRPDDRRCAVTFNQAKGHGNGMQNQPTVTCSSPPVTMTAGEAGIPGVDPSDIVEQTFTAQLVLKP